jgi:U4/U6.U5 tri-snRNP-associated protein 2
LHPKFARPQAVDNNTTMLLSHSGDSYLPGYIGLNDISSNDWLNATVQALVHVAPLRSFFLVESNYEKVGSFLRFMN